MAKEKRVQNLNVTWQLGCFLLVVALITIFIIAALSSGGKRQTPKQSAQTAQTVQPTKPENELIVYEIKAEAKAINSNTIAVSGETNLPDGSVISVVINRISIWHGEDEERFFRVGFANLKVQNKKFSGEISVDDKKFLEFEKVSGEFIKELNDNVEVVIILIHQVNYNQKAL